MCVFHFRIVRELTNSHRRPPVVQVQGLHQMMLQFASSPHIAEGDWHMWQVPFFSCSDIKGESSKILISLACWAVSVDLFLIVSMIVFSVYFYYNLDVFIVGYRHHSFCGIPRPSEEDIHKRAIEIVPGRLIRVKRHRCHLFTRECKLNLFVVLLFSGFIIIYFEVSYVCV